MVADENIGRTDLLAPLRFAEAEVVLGVVAAVGVNLDAFEQDLENHLRKFRYSLDRILLSDCLKSLNHGVRMRESPEFDRIKTRMDAGNKVREAAGRGDFLALTAVSLIKKRRGGAENNEPLQRCVHLLRTLKHPDEVLTLRRIYGPGFFVIGVFATQQERLHYLVQDKDVPEPKAMLLVQRDQDEGKSLGQRTRDTFHLADVFVSLDDKDQLWRFIDLVFGSPFITPARDEHAMFAAYAASLKSASLGRQVGAAIASADGEIIAVGCNEVPRFGGGTYCEGESPDHRDHIRGADSNDEYIDRILKDIETRLGIRATKRNMAEMLKGSILFDVTEFGRAVHAEMEALFEFRAQRGESSRRYALNCARHIIAAGIRRVVYIEPYPKSRATDLHDDAIVVERAANSNVKKVCFEPFVGVGPRRYFDLFSTSLSSGLSVHRKTQGKPVKWVRKDARVRVPMLPTSYLEREQLAIAQVQDQLGGTP